MRHKALSLWGARHESKLMRDQTKICLAPPTFPILRRLRRQAMNLTLHRLNCLMGKPPETKRMWWKHLIPLPTVRMAYGVRRKPARGRHLSCILSLNYTYIKRVTFKEIDRFRKIYRKITNKKNYPAPDVKRKKVENESEKQNEDYWTWLENQLQ